MIKNNSLHFIKPKNLLLKDQEFKIKKQNVLINVKSCGMCGTDLKIFNFGSKRVKKNRVMGHEISGKIIHVPLGQKYFKKGENIILGADIEGVNKADEYALGHEIDGGFQKYLSINVKLLKKVPHYKTLKKIDYDLTSVTEPLACCLNGLEKINLKPNSKVIIFGAGTIGQLIAKLCIFFKSKKVYLIDKNKFKLKQGVKEKKIIKMNYSSFEKKLKNKAEGIKYIFVACSSQEAQRAAVNFSSKNATINFFAGLPKLHGSDPRVEINTNAIHYKQLKIVGSHGSESKHIKKAAKLIIGKKVKINNLITDKYKLTDYKKAFLKLKKGKALKIIIKP